MPSQCRNVVATTDTRLTAQRLLISLKRLQGGGTAVESLEVFSVQSKSRIAVLDNVVVLWRVQVDVTRSTVGEEDGFRFGSDGDCARVVINCC